MKSILLLEKSPVSMLSNNFTGAVDLAIAMLAQNKKLETVISAFEKEFKLERKSMNAKWKKDLKMESKRQLKLKRIAEKKMHRQRRKEQKEYTQKRQEWLQQHIQREEEAVEQEIYDSLLEERVLPIEKWRKVSENKGNKEMLDKEQEQYFVPVKTKQSPNNGGLKDKMPARIGKEKIFESEARKKSSQEKEDDDPEEIFTVDSFFITETGENYLSTAVVKRKEEETTGKPNTDTLIMENTAILERPHSSTHYLSSFAAPSRPLLKTDWKIFSINESASKSGSLRSGENIVDRDIHPSWLAKQKMKPVIQEFRGKKITFNDEDEE